MLVQQGFLISHQMGAVSSRKWIIQGALISLRTRVLFLRQRPVVTGLTTRAMTDCCSLPVCLPVCSSGFLSACDPVCLGGRRGFVAVAEGSAAPSSSPVCQNFVSLCLYMQELLEANRKCWKLTALWGLIRLSVVPPSIWFGGSPQGHDCRSARSRHGPCPPDDAHTSLIFHHSVFFELIPTLLEAFPSGAHERPLLLMLSIHRTVGRLSASTGGQRSPRADPRAFAHLHLLSVQEIQTHTCVL